MILPDFRENRACGVRFLAEKHIFWEKWIFSKKYVDSYLKR